jgi:hypothetical protein
MPPRGSNKTISYQRKDASFDGPSLPDISDTPSIVGDSADRVFHILELAQQIVYELELKDFFRALPITKDLWESKIPDRVWADHLKRLGYPDHVIRNTSQCLRTCYVSISQAVDAISRNVESTSKTIHIEKIREKNYVYSKCGNGMEPPFLLQSSSPPYFPGLGQTADLYVLDGEDLKLLKPNVTTLPFLRIYDGSFIVGQDDSESYVMRKFEDWSLTAQFEIQPGDPSSGGNLENKTWNFHDEFIISKYKSPWEEEGHPFHIIEFWDKQGLKRGESTSPGLCCIDFYSSKGNHYLTLWSPSHVKSWKLDTLDVLFELTLSASDIKDTWRFNVFEGIVFLRCYFGENKALPRYWTVNGRPMSRKVAEMLRYGQHSTALKFSDGCRVFWGHKLMLCDDKRGIIKKFDREDNDTEWQNLECGFLFDRFFFIISSCCDSGDRSLTVYSKEGDEVTSIVMERWRRGSFDYFVDILGRLVLIHKPDCRYVDKIEVIDFRGAQIREGGSHYSAPVLGSMYLAIDDNVDQPLL